MKTFAAPWGKSLVVLSIVSSALCVAIAFMPHTAATPANQHFSWLRAVPLALMAGCALFTIRGYRVGEGAVWVQRLFWSTRLPLQELQSAEFIPNAMAGSLRTCGNGGFYSFSGCYRSKLLGPYRAYVTDQRVTVVLRFPSRTVVLSPASPEDFLREVSAARTSPAASAARDGSAAVEAQG